jgi:hypothetical protein
MVDVILNLHTISHLEMWGIPRLYVSACTNSVQLVPLHPFIISILFHHYKELKECIYEVMRIAVSRGSSNSSSNKKKERLMEKEEEEEQEKNQSEVLRYFLKSSSLYY